MTPELAESWEASEDGKTYIFHLRKDATFHDGSPVTAKDVKWSFDRAIAAGGFPAVQMAAPWSSPNSSRWSTITPSRRRSISSTS
ncbi:ABC-type transport system substrate-binding protein [Bradyrhizobium japonicum]|uniref:ABC transporter substrate-binding protein n=1 Tax=Bradyrhizobium TaxID=374 RepID=UPI00041A584B|nr:MULTISPECIES: ABC transporter substrate-binding protein [Bradyrhizobium]MCP1740184.1 ABC-type transport system substrate-binding protein [Bradyrhizobium japonicum]MCP1778418.1 ABC-type transport system substrate-binding protein [Bradyrhizobium japonicum]MCP1857860.1 ABC-type transport system substrate-binding protein [Bradyrhizobium japonicum]MCP1888674.1 ABC-type transport system substrate-binding protein [Bradyrhizobium japonicum]MCP1958584.1 ABC-type transport system substrate-binding pr